MIVTYKFDRKTILYFLAVVLCILIGVAIRLYFIQYQSISLDEAQSLWQAGHPLHGGENMFLVMARDLHPPLFNFLLHNWMKYAGDKTYLLRLLPMSFGVLAIPFMYALVKEIFGRAEALLATFFVSIGPLWVWYSLNIKNYSLFMLAIILSLLFYFKILHGKHVALYSILYMLVQLAGMYSHYLFVFVILVELIGAMFYKNYKFIALNMVSMLMYSPWALYFIAHHSTSTQPSLGGINLFNIILSYFELLFGYHSADFYKAVISLWPFIILSMFVYIHAFRRQSKDVLVLLIGAVVPIIISFLVSRLIISIFLTRYLIYTTVFLYIIIAFGVLSVENKLFRYGSIALFSLALFAATLNQMYDPNSVENENYRGAVAYISAHATKQDLIVVSAPFIIYPFEHYYRGKVDYTTLPYWDRKEAINFSPTPDQMNELINASKGKYMSIYLLESYDQSYQNETVNWFKNHLHQADHDDFGANVAVYQFALPQGPKVLAGRY